MKKTKLLTSLAAFVLILGLGGCNSNSDEGTTSSEDGTTSQTTESGGTPSESEGTTPSEGDEEGGNENQEAKLLGSFNFATNEKDGTLISSASDLDDFWTGDASLYRGVSEYDTVYLGNGTGGAFADVTTLLKFGTGSANGKLQLKFAAGTCISEVVVTAHSWYKISEEFPEQEPNQLVVNGISQDCSVSGTATELKYEITDDLERYVTFESVGRVTIHSIDIYGTYEPEKLETVTLSLSATTTELMVGASTDVSVSWLPEDAIFDEEDLVWSSSDETIATVDGGIVTGVATGSATITATSSLNSAITASIEFTITEATGTILTYLYTFNGNEGISTTGGSYTLGGLTWTTTTAAYIGFDSSSGRGLQVGSSNNAQTTPWTISTDFGEDVTLTSIAVNVVGASSSTGANFTITHGDTKVADAVSFSTTAADYEYTNLEVSGSELSISMVCTAKAMYLKYISFTIIAGTDSTLNW